MINTVKIQSEGYLVNGYLSVPNSPSNKHYQEVQEWIAQGNTPEPEFTQAELDQQAIDTTNAESRAYLASTDWYVIRQQETGVAIPQDILDARNLARSKVI